MKKEQKIPFVAIVGRTNVGKSTLFNRLIQSSKALTSPIPGTTRDPNFSLCEWRGKMFELADTGGLEPGMREEIEQNIRRQAERAIERADLILLVLDVQSGILPTDKELARALVKSKKPVIVVANKSDNLSLSLGIHAADWQKLAFREIYSVSAVNGLGTGDLLDEILKKLKKLKIKLPEAKTPEPTIRVAILGKPNVGKSSLLNAILKEERVIVSPIPGTTREPQDTLFEWGEEKIMLIDTAGIRKAGRIEEGLEKLSVSKTESIIRRADIVLLILDLGTEIGSQDRRLTELVRESSDGLIIVGNKYDLIRETARAEQIDLRKYNLKKEVETAFPFISWAPVMLVSAKTGWHTEKILYEILKVAAERRKEISEKELKYFLRAVLKEKKPLKTRGFRHPYIYRIKQVKSAPPVFMLAIRAKAPVNNAYLKFIEKRLRDKFGFEGTPVKITQKVV